MSSKNVKKNEAYVSKYNIDAILEEIQRKYLTKKNAKVDLEDLVIRVRELEIVLSNILLISSSMLEYMFDFNLINIEKFNDIVQKNYKIFEKKCKDKENE